MSTEFEQTVLKALLNIQNKLDDTNERITELDVRLNKKIDDVEARLNAKIDNVETKFNEKVDSLTTIVNRIEHKVDKLHNRFDDMEQTVILKFKMIDITLDEHSKSIKQLQNLFL